MAWQRILAMDAHVTAEVVTWLEKYLPLEQLKIHYQLLEVCVNNHLLFNNY